MNHHAVNTHTHATHTTTCENLFCISSKILCLQLQKIPWWQNNNNNSVQEKPKQPRAQGRASRYERHWCMISVKGQNTGERWRSRGGNVKIPL